MQTLNTAFERKLTEMIEAEIEGEKDKMSAGAMDHDAYKVSAGKIMGYRDILKMFEDVNKHLDER